MSIARIPFIGLAMTVPVKPNSSGIVWDTSEVALRYGWTGKGVRKISHSAYNLPTEWTKLPLSETPFSCGRESRPQSERT